MCRKGCGHPASNASISSATFSLLALILAICAPLGPAYSISISSYAASIITRSSVRADAVLGLTDVSVSTSLGGVGVTTSYGDFVKSDCMGLCPGLSKDTSSRGSALLSSLKQAGNGAGQGAMACFFLSALCLFVHVVGTIMHACNLRHAPPPCANCCASAPLGLTACLVGYVLLIAGSALVWGVFGTLASAAAAYALTTVGFLGASVLWIPLSAPVLAGLALAFATIALACELGARMCCKDWKPPSAAFASPGGASTIVVLPAAAGGGWGAPPPHLPQAVYAPSYMQQPHLGMPPPPGLGHPPPRPHKEAPPIISAAAPPPAMTHWRIVTDGSDTCASFFSRARASCLAPPPPSQFHAPTPLHPCAQGTRAMRREPLSGPYPPAACAWPSEWWSLGLQPPPFSCGAAVSGLPLLPAEHALAFVAV